MDVVELLEHDHRMVEQLFRDYQSAASPTQRRGVVEILICEVSRHAALEELMVYPLGKEVLRDGEQEIEEHLAEPMTVKKLLHELDGLKGTDARSDQFIIQLQNALPEHIQEEEGDFFPALREGTDEQALQELGAALETAKHTAPTGPHPAAPTGPPGLALAAPLAAIYDRMRDRLQGRPKT